MTYRILGEVKLDNGEFLPAPTSEMLMKRADADKLIPCTIQAQQAPPPIQLIGIIWSGDDKPLIFNWRMHGQFVPTESPQMEESARELARAEGKSLGETVDDLNAIIAANEPKPMFSLTITLTGEQAEQLREIMLPKDTTD